MRRLIPLVVLFAAGFAFAGGGSLIPEVGGTPAPKPVQAPPGRVDLTDAETADAMVTALVADGTRGTEKLAEIALEHRDLAARGRAIVGLARAEGSKADTTLEKLRNSGSDEQLVRTWAYAASLQRAPDLSTVLALASEQGRYTGSERAVQLAAGRYLQDASAVELLEMAGSVPALNAAIGPMLLEVPPAELGALMLTHPNDNVRRQAAAWLGSQATQKGRTDAVARITIDQLRHDPGVGDVPWKGGALYIPGIQWDQKRARELVRTLIQWKLYCERTGKSGEKNQVWNNLRSVQLLQAAGFQNAWPNDEQVLEEWARIGGKGDVEKLRGEQGVGVMRYLLPLLVGCALTGPDDLPPATVTFADGRTVDAADCAKGCSGPTPDDLHPLEHDAAIAHLRAWQEQPVGEATEDLETLLFHRKVALEVLDQHGDVLDTAHADFLRAELSRNRVEVAFRLVDDDGVVLGESARTSPLKEKQHIVLEQTGSLKHIVISGKTKRVGLHHLWSRW